MLLFCLDSDLPVSYIWLAPIFHVGALEIYKALNERSRIYFT